MGPKARRRRETAGRNGTGGSDDLICPKNLRMRRVEARTEAQSTFFDAFGEGRNAVLHGTAGTGKTFLAVYAGLLDVMSGNSGRNRVVVVRSVVPTRDVGFLPGKLSEKVGLYELPYHLICSQLFNRGDAYEVLKSAGSIEFMTTSFVRGTTIDDAVVVVDEFQNMTGHEIDSVVTRLGRNCRVVFCGDSRQSDLDRNGFGEFMRVASRMPSFRLIEFGPGDILRSDFVREYILAREAVRETLPTPAG